MKIRLIIKRSMADFNIELDDNLAVKNTDKPNCHIAEQVFLKQKYWSIIYDFNEYGEFEFQFKLNDKGEKTLKPIKVVTTDDEDMEYKENIFFVNIKKD